MQGRLYAALMLGSLLGVPGSGLCQETNMKEQQKRQRIIEHLLDGNSSEDLADMLHDHLSDKEKKEILQYERRLDREMRRQRR